MIHTRMFVVAVLLIIVLFTSTSTASFLTSQEKLLNRFQENSAFRKVWQKVSQIITHNDNSLSIIEKDTIDEDLTDTDNLQENILLPNIINVIPDDGNDVVVEENTLEDTPTIESNGEQGTTQTDDHIITENGELGITKEITIEKDGANGRTLERVIKIIKGRNEKFGTMLQQVVEHTYAPGTTKSDGVAENIVDTVVIIGESGETSVNNNADVVVITNTDP